MKYLMVLMVSAFLLSAGNVIAGSSKDWHTKTYAVSDFSKLYIEGGYKIVLIQGEKSEVKVKASDTDVFEYLQVRNENGKLRIDMEPDHFDFDRIVLQITFKDLNKIHIEGGVKLSTKGYLDLKELDLYVAGGANIDIELKSDLLEIVGEGGVLFSLQGVTDELIVKISGAGHVDADQLKSKHVSFKVEGVGTGTVHATETLNARIEGVGRIKYRGKPQLTKSIEGVGAVVQE